MLKTLTNTKIGLTEAQEYIGGYIERIKLPNGNVLLIDEEGRVKGLKENTAASVLAGQHIVGKAIYLAGRTAKAGWR